VRPQWFFRNLGKKILFARTLHAHFEIIYL